MSPIYPSDYGQILPLNPSFADEIFEPFDALLSCMPRTARYTWPGLPHHITQRGNNGNQVFYPDKDHDVYLNLLKTGLAQAGVSILAYVLMPNHVHLIAVPQSGDSLPVLMRRLSGRYAAYANTTRQCNGHLWQGRFYSSVMSPRHLSHALRYVELNPVRAKLVKRPIDYPWSSARAHLRGEDTHEILDMEFARKRGSEKDWDRMLTGVSGPDPNLARIMDNLLRRCTHAERPFGDEEFLQQAELFFGRTWRRWPFEKTLSEQTVTYRFDHLGPPMALAATTEI